MKKDSKKEPEVLEVVKHNLDYKDNGFYEVINVTDKLFKVRARVQGAKVGDVLTTSQLQFWMKIEKIIVYRDHKGTFINKDLQKMSYLECEYSYFETPKPVVQNEE